LLILTSFIILASTETDLSGSFASQLVPLMGTKNKKPTAAEGCLPWRGEPSNVDGTISVVPLA
jgi:hypothetical protein